MRIRKWMWSRPDGPEEARKGARQQGACKTERRGRGCKSSKILSLQRPGLCISMAVSDVLWKRKLQGKKGSLLLGEEGHKVLKSQTLVPGRILLSCP